ncbi:hypothetical protein [Herbiconiux liukaitaii]|uniref:hypothetical protein n=1 Tax=Herbiconiux liukaitaii TaxID=3342799 RepID=UPI0035BB6D8B
MTTTGADALSSSPTLAAELLATASTVPGVTGVFPTVLAPKAVLDTAVALLTQRTPQTVLVEEGEGGITVTLSIGVDHSFSAAETCRAVYDAVAAQLATSEPGSSVAGIRVSVAQVG